MKTYFKAFSMSPVTIVGLITVFAMALLTGCSKQEEGDVQRQGCSLSIQGPDRFVVGNNAITISRSPGRVSDVDLRFTPRGAVVVNGGNARTVTTNAAGRVTVPIVLNAGNPGDSLIVGAESRRCSQAARTFRL